MNTYLKANQEFIALITSLSSLKKVSDANLYTKNSNELKYKSITHGKIIIGVYFISILSLIKASVFLLNRIGM